MILQSKMNYETFITTNCIYARNYLNGLEINRWHPIDEIPASIIGEVITLIDEEFNGCKKAILNETDEYFKIIEVEKEKTYNLMSNILILNKENGIYYESYSEAWDSIGNIFSKTHFRNMLNGERTNRTNLKIV